MPDRAAGVRVPVRHGDLVQRFQRHADEPLDAVQDGFPAGRVLHFHAVDEEKLPGRRAAE